MTRSADRSRPPRLALTRTEAAASLGVSLDTFSRHVQPDLRLVRVGRKVIVPIAELERYVHENAAVALRDETR